MNVRKGRERERREIGTTMTHYYYYCSSFDHYYLVVIADIISAVEFDHTGDYLATGDKGGRVVLFERNESVRNTKEWYVVFGLT